MILSKYFKWTADLEGVSYLILLFIAMPLKYMWNEPSAVKIVGMIHGVLFVAYVIVAFAVKKEQGWNSRQFFLVLFLSFVPFGTFYMVRKMMK